MDLFESGSISILYSYFINNKDTLFKCTGIEILVKNCFIYHNDNLTSGNINLINNSYLISELYTYIIYHFYSYYCEGNLILNGKFSEFTCNLNFYQKFRIIFSLFIFQQF